MICLFFDTLPALRPDALREGVAAVYGGSEKAQVDRSVTRVTVAGHAVQMSPVPVALADEAYAVALQRAPITAAQAARIRAHQAHVRLTLADGSASGVEGMIALYAVASALRGAGLSGVMNMAARSIQAAESLDVLLSEAYLRAFRLSPASAAGVWIGEDGFRRREGGWWIVTLGAGVYGLPDLARRIESPASADLARVLFADVLSYLYQTGKPASSGQVIRIGDRRLRFSTPTEYHNRLGASTLVLEDVFSVIRGVL